ncbi:MAG: hypothetical protein Q4D54_04715 [Eubacteriales bacterium]|nr:hypothetical protein [Eubacteriales bacterium]
MGLFDKVKAYLNEEEPSEKATIHKPKKEPKNRIKARTSQKAKDDDDRVHKEHDTHAIIDEQQMVQDFCEQLVDVSAHMEEIKNEYRVVTEYLTDIQRIEELPVQLAEDINETAKTIAMLDADRQKYLQSENLLPLEQYNTLVAYEDEVIDTIKRLNEIEMRDSMLKSDMGHLEGEKESLKYTHEDGADSIERLRGILITVLVIFLLTSGGLFAYAAAAKKSVTLYMLIIGAVAMLSFVIAYVRYVDIKKDVRDADTKLNRAISLLNKVKVKYINNVNTMEYIYRKFNVSSCKELEYRFELYQTMLRDEKRFDRADSDLRVWQERLEKKLERVGVRDTAVWLNQVTAFVNREELYDIKQGLLDRRQSLRKKMAISEQIRDNAMTALRAAVADNPGHKELIAELLTPHGLVVTPGASE